MKPYIPVAIGLAISFLLPSAHAQTCQWKDAAGHTVVSDTPPPGNVRDLRCVGGTGFGATTPAAAPSAANNAGAPKTIAEKDADFKKRQLENKEKADKDAKEQQAADARKENCERAKKVLASLESGRRVATVDEKGEQRIMEDNERQQETERARQGIADSCK